ncbi:MAG: hypothetical protein E6J90_38700 [Deltaproteobacteria bacterium]|nr:MAG: hypothetical protein E6J90_38700 [Deltaproteobacteria bacterium]
MKPVSTRWQLNDVPTAIPALTVWLSVICWGGASIGEPSGGGTSVPSRGPASNSPPMMLFSLPARAHPAITRQSSSQRMALS